MQKHRVGFDWPARPNIAVIVGVIVASAAITSTLAVALSGPPPHARAVTTVSPTAAPTADRTRVEVMAPAPIATPIQPTVLAIGDSIMKGYGDPDGVSWLNLIAQKQNWNLIDRSCNGAGFITVAHADCATTLTAVISGTAGLNPDFVIVEGSANDSGTDTDRLAAVTTHAIEQLRTLFPRATIIGLPVAWGDQQPPRDLVLINAQIAAAMASVKGIYVDFGTPLLAHPELMQYDHLHPLPSGQAALEAAIEQAIARAGIVI